MRRFYLLLLLVFVLFISLTSVSYAYTIDDVLSYSYQLKDKTSTSGGGTQAYDFMYTKLNQYWTSINNAINSYASDCSYFIVGCQYAYSSYNDSGNRVYIHCFTNSPPLTHSNYLSGTNTYEKVNFSTNSNYYKGSLSVRANNGALNWYSETSNYICADINGNPPKGFFLIADGDYSSYVNYNINGLIPPYTGPEFTVSTFNTSTIPVFANGQTENFQKLQFTTQMRLKDLGNITNFSEVYAIKGNFGPYVTDDIIDGSQSEFYYNKFGGTQNGTLVFYSDTGLVQIRSSKLIPKQGYNLNLAYQTEKNGEWTDFADVNFYALYYGDLSSSGDLVSPDLNSTVDIGFVRALDEFFNPTSGEISEASESIFQKDFGK